MLTIFRLYSANATFREGIATWAADRSCPFGLADFLRESGFHKAAKLADYCASALLVPEYGTASWELVGVYPLLNTESGKPIYRFSAFVLTRNYAHNIAPHTETWGHQYIYALTPTRAILKLLQTAEDRTDA